MWLLASEICQTSGPTKHRKELQGTENSAKNYNILVNEEQSSWKHYKVLINQPQGNWKHR